MYHKNKEAEQKEIGFSNGADESIELDTEKWFSNILRAFLVLENRCSYHLQRICERDILISNS